MRKGKVLIHCEVGVSRSGGIVVGELLLENPGWSWNQARNLVEENHEISVSYPIRWSVQYYVNRRRKRERNGTGR